MTVSRKCGVIGLSCHLMSSWCYKICLKTILNPMIQRALLFQGTWLIYIPKVFFTSLQTFASLPCPCSHAESAQESF